MQDKDKEKAKLLQNAVRFLSYRSRSRHEVTQYLEKKIDNDPQLLASVMDKLEEFNLLNDKEFTAAYIKSQLQKGKGPQFIRKKLTFYGVERKIQNEILNSVDPEAFIESASKIILKKLSRWENETGKLKVLKIRKYLYSRGYSHNTISAVIDDLDIGE